MGMLGVLGGPLLKLARTMALKDAKSWADENLGRGPNALGPVTKDIDKLTIEVYRYTATLKTASVSLDAPRDTASAKSAFCTTAYGPDELQTAQEIVKHLQTIKARLGGVVASATQNAQSDAANSAQAAQQAGADLNRASAQPGNQSGARFFAQSAGQYTSAQVFADTNVIIIQRRGKDLAATVDSLIQEMQNNIALLQANWNAWLKANRECFQWQAQVLEGLPADGQ